MSATKSKAQMSSTKITSGPNADRVWAAGRYATDSTVSVPLTFTTEDGIFTLGRILDIKWGGPCSVQVCFRPFDAIAPWGESVKCAVWYYDTGSRKDGELVYIDNPGFFKLSDEDRKAFG